MERDEENKTEQEENGGMQKENIEQQRKGETGTPKKDRSWLRDVRQMFVAAGVILAVVVIAMIIADATVLNLARINAHMMGGRTASFSSDVKAMHETGQITEEQYQNFAKAFNAIAEATCKEERITSNMVREYNKSVKDLKVIDSSNYKLNRTRANYPEFSFGFKDRECYTIVYEWFLWDKKLDDKEYRVYDFLRDEVSTGSRDKGYEAYINYLEELFERCDGRSVSEVVLERVKLDY